MDAGFFYRSASSEAFVFCNDRFSRHCESLSASANAVSVNLSHALSAAEKTLGIACTFAFFPFNNIFSQMLVFVAKPLKANRVITAFVLL
jgi:hypothetical protein